MANLIGVCIGSASPELAELPRRARGASQARTLARPPFDINGFSYSHFRAIYHQWYPTTRALDKAWRRYRARKDYFAALKRPPLRIATPAFARLLARGLASGVGDFAALRSSLEFSIHHSKFPAQPLPDALIAWVGSLCRHIRLPESSFEYKLSKLWATNINKP